MSIQFSEHANVAKKIAEEMADKLAHGYIGTEHLLLGLLGARGTAAQLLAEHGVSFDKLMKLIGQLISTDTATIVADKHEYTPRAKAVLVQAEREAKLAESPTIGTENILSALLKTRDSIALRLLNTMGVDVMKLFDDMNAVSTGEIHGRMSGAMLGHGNMFRQQRARSNTPALDQFSKDLTLYAAEGKLDPVIGRDTQIDRVIQILSRRTKNNPCVIGEPGVGKTAIAEGLAQKIVDDEVPDTIRGKRVLTLDISGMVAGSKYRGEFEERIKRAVSEAINDGGVLLFIDELHTIIGAGGAEGSIDASAILKPSLARGELQIIGATTREEYRKYIEKDAALERRFQPVELEEPSEEEAVLILKGLRPRYEEYHKVVITDDALVSAVKLSMRYISDRYLPDKAVDVMDEAASKAKLTVFTDDPKIKVIRDKIAALEKKKEDAIVVENFEMASTIKRDQDRLTAQVERIKSDTGRGHESNVVTVTSAEIENVVSDWTKIPVSKIAQEESLRMLELGNRLHERVIGQDEAVDAVSRAIRRGRVGLKDPKRPIGSFLFLGPTGVGKTELCKALASELFGDETSMIRVDMSEYMEKHSVSKMIGSPPGYVGYDEGGQLSEKVRRHPYSVILFDEIEKAHSDVFNVLLQVLDDGHITDAQGRKVSFKNTVIIMTSNAGAMNIISPKRLGFSAGKDEKADYTHMKDAVMSEIKNIFKPEFINRIDEIIVFHPLSKDDVRKIVQLMLREVTDRCVEALGIKMKSDDGLFDFISEKGFDDKFGARPLRRAISTHVEDALAQMVLEGKAGMGDTVTVSAKEGKVSFKVRHRKSA